MRLWLSLNAFSRSRSLPCRHHQQQRKKPAQDFCAAPTQSAPPCPADTGNTSNKHKGAPAPALPTPKTAIWGAIVNFERVGSEDAEDADPTDGGDGGASRKRKPRTYIVDVLANCAADTLPGMGPRR